MRVRMGEHVHDLLPRATSSASAVVVDGRPVSLHVEELRPGTFVAELGPRREIFHCVRDGREILLFWQGAAYRLREEREGAQGSRRGGTFGLEAPMPGKVIAVRVVPGQEVALGQELLVIEAMKMENALRAPRAGRVKSVSAGVGEMVSPGSVLVELE
jgi:acetyl/propionyl-CoA carboxylase alpha subunit